MLKKFTLYLLLSFVINTSLVFPFTLKEKLQEATSFPGSFILIEHEHTVSFLRLHSFDPPFLYLEEINLPSHAIKKGMQWEPWLQENAPQHTSWLLYQIDLDSCKILQCYSFSRNSFISLSGQESFLATLMALPLQKVPLSERKKIGPKPPSDMTDTRKLWNPPKIFEGKKHKNSHFEVMHTTWPKDDSELSGRGIDLYFDQNQPLFPFPYWIEIGDSYNTLALRVIDSGYCSLFPLKHFPLKPPSILSLSLEQEGLKISLQDAKPFKTFQVIATQKSSKTYTSTLLPYILHSDGSLTQLLISREILAKHLNLEKNLEYTVTVIPIENPSLVMEYLHKIKL